MDILVYYALISLFTFGIGIAAPDFRPCLTDFFVIFAFAVLSPIVLPIWLGTAVRSYLQKVISA